MARKLDDDTYMVVSPGSKKIFFLDSLGKTVREYNTRNNTFGAVIRPNGNIVYSCMDGLVELDKAGNEIWTLLKDDVPEINICWLLGIHLHLSLFWEQRKQKYFPSFSVSKHSTFV